MSETPDTEHEKRRRQLAAAFNTVLSCYYPEGVEKRRTVAFHLADQALAVLEAQ